jgi:chemotaxis protein CheC
VAAEAAALPVRGIYLDPLQLDAVREAANVGACNAAQALSGLTGRRIDVDPPTVAVRPVSELLDILNAPGGRVAAVVDTVLGDLTGQVVFVMPQQAGGGQDGGGEAFFTKAETLEPDMFRRAADLVIGSYVDHIGGMMGLVLGMVPGAPAVHDGAELAAGLGATLGAGNRFAFCVDSRFTLSESGAKLAGHFLFLPEMSSLPVIVGALFGAGRV